LSHKIEEKNDPPITRITTAMPPNIVVKNVPRPDPALLKRLAEFGVATIHEAQGRTGLLAPSLRPIYTGAKASGSALTVLAHPGDNIMLHVAAEVCRPGDVIVVGLSSENQDGMLGELLATSFRARGAMGIIIDAGCRDVAEMTKMSFPVWSKAVSAKGTVKATLGSINVPVVCGGTLINPGDAILADDDGVVTIPRAELEAVLEAANQREEKEAKVRSRLASGELGLDIYNMRPKLEQLGLVYLDSDRESDVAPRSFNAEAKSEHEAKRA
jgi:4-hydroxy-4-methyl-2-oxoglutarate aldolase